MSKPGTLIVRRRRPLRRPPEYGCPQHGCGCDWTVYHRPDGTRYVCLACRRERESKTHFRVACCVKGHPRNRWNWRHGRCETCYNIARRSIPPERRAAINARRRAVYAARRGRVDTPSEPTLCSAHE